MPDARLNGRRPGGQPWTRRCLAMERDPENAGVSVVEERTRSRLSGFVGRYVSLVPIPFDRKLIQSSSKFEDEKLCRKAYKSGEQQIVFFCLSCSADYYYA